MAKRHVRQLVLLGATDASSPVTWHRITSTRGFAVDGNFVAIPYEDSINQWIQIWQYGSV